MLGKVDTRPLIDWMTVDEWLESGRAFVEPANTLPVEDKDADVDTGECPSGIRRQNENAIGSSEVPLFIGSEGMMPSRRMPTDLQPIDDTPRPQAVQRQSENVCPRLVFDHPVRVQSPPLILDDRSPVKSPPLVFGHKAPPPPYCAWW